MSYEPLQTRDPDVREELTTRSMQVRVQTANEEERSIEAVISTDNPVEVWDWRHGEMIDEILLTGGTDLPRQLPLLASHDRWNLDAVLGSARNLRDGGGEIVARLFFVKDDPDAERAWGKASQGHLTDVSVGYRVDESVEIQPDQTATVAGRVFRAGKRALRIATKWRLREVSLVPIGADQAAKLRQASITKGEKMKKELREYLETIGLRADATDAQAEEFFKGLKDEKRTRADEIKEGKRSATSPDPPPKKPPPADPPANGDGRTAPDPPPDPAAIAREAIAAERERVRTLTELAGDDVPAKLLALATTEGWDETRAAPEFLKAVREGRQEGVGPAIESPAIHSRDPAVDCNVRSLAAGTLMGDGLDPTQHSLHRGARIPLRGDRLTEQDADRGERLRGLSAPDLFRECLRLDTGRSYLNLDEAFHAVREAPSGGSLAWVFGTNVYARLIAGWETTEDTTGGWCDEEDVPNFLLQEDISVEAQARLEQRARGGTANDASISDKHETYKIARYAKKFGVDEQDIIDVRLSAIMRMPAELGMAARRLRPDLVYSIMLENPTLVADSGTVFNATAVSTAGGHANLGTGALGSATLKAAITAMGVQRDSNDNVLNITPKYLVIPSELSWTADELLSPAMIAKLFADVADPQATTENLIARRRLVPVVDDRLGATGVVDPRDKTGVLTAGSDTHWFLAAGGSKSIRVAYRRGTGRSPLLRSYVWDKGQWGMGWDINLDIGAAFMDFRGWYKSTGAG